MPRTCSWWFVRVILTDTGNFPSLTYNLTIGVNFSFLLKDALWRKIWTEHLGLLEHSSSTECGFGLPWEGGMQKKCKHKNTRASCSHHQHTCKTCKTCKSRSHTSLFSAVGRIGKWLEESVWHQGIGVIGPIVLLKESSEFSLQGLLVFGLVGHRILQHLHQQHQ